MENIDKINVIEEYKKVLMDLPEDYLLDKKSIIIRFEPNAPEEDVKAFEDKFNLKNKIELFKDLNIFRYELGSTYEMNLDTLTKINESEINLYAEPNYKYNLQVEPNYNFQWGLKNKSYFGIDINVEEAWKLTKGISSVVVAIIDSGTDYIHNDLVNNIWRNRREIQNNKIDDDKNGYVDDIIGWNFYENNCLPYDQNSHGTHISGIIAATENNYGIIGVAPNVKLMSLKAFGKNGEAASLSEILKSIQYANNNKATIVNMSFAGRGYSQAMYDVMNNSKGILFVCAAGNNHANIDQTLYYPGSFTLPNNITVASIDINGALSGYSNYGVKTVDVAAPGGNIFSALPQNRFGYKSGTSMATPFVSGLAALIKSYKASLTPVQIIQVIENNTKALQSLKGKVKTGGLIDAGKALKSIK